MPFFVIFRCVRDILRVTVAFEHPVSIYHVNMYLIIVFGVSSYQLYQYTSHESKYDRHICVSAYMNISGQHIFCFSMSIYLLHIYDRYICFQHINISYQYIFCFSISMYLINIYDQCICCVSISMMITSAYIWSIYLLFQHINGGSAVQLGKDWETSWNQLDGHPFIRYSWWWCWWC